MQFQEEVFTSLLLIDDYYACVCDGNTSCCDDGIDFSASLVRFPCSFASSTLDIVMMSPQRHQNLESNWNQNQPCDDASQSDLHNAILDKFQYEIRSQTHT